MSGKRQKQTRQAVRKAVTSEHHAIISMYVDGIVKWPFRLRLKFAFNILRKQNPFKDDHNKTTKKADKIKKKKEE